MRVVSTYCDREAMRAYPTIPGLLFVAETAAGHAMLCCPMPGDFVPMVWRDITDRRQAMAEMPLVMTNLHVRAAYRGQGLGVAMVKACQAYATRKKLPIVLRALPYGRAKAMTQQGLIDFYVYCGFAYAGMHHENHYLIWEPGYGVCNTV